MREADIQRQILDYLTLKGIFHYRQNSGAFRRDDHFYRMGVAGAPDIICVVGGRYIGIEVKAPGGKQNDNQIEFQRPRKQIMELASLAFVERAENVVFLARPVTSISSSSAISAPSTNSTNGNSPCPGNVSMEVGT